MRVMLVMLMAGSACVAPDAFPDTAVCGDAVVQVTESCDDGVNDGAYGGCASDCRARGPWCGDGEVNGEESCDDGVNDGTWGSCAHDCAAAGPSCGDGIVNGPELCDDGQNRGGYGGCRRGCLQLGPRCGDGEVNGAEVCDDGVNDGTCGSCAGDCLDVARQDFLTGVTIHEVSGDYGFPADFTPDLYLEVYGADDALLAVTATLDDRDPPVSFVFADLPIDGEDWTVVIWDEDGGAFGDDDYLGEFVLPTSEGSGEVTRGRTRVASWTIERLACGD